MNTLQDKFLEHMKKFNKPVKINGIDNIAFFKEIDDKGSEDTKYMFTAIGTCNQGDLIEYAGCSWIIISQGKSNNGVYQKALIKKSQYNINFIFDGIFKSFPAIFDTKTMDIETNQYISLPANTIKVTMQLNSYTINLGVNDRFINTGRAWKITGVDRTKDNLITLTCDVDSIANDDDLVNEVANKNAYSISIINSVFTINEGDSIQVNAEFKHGSSILNNVFFEYLVDNVNIATISNTGLLTGISVGIVNVTVKVKDNPYYKAACTFTIEQVVLAPTYEIVPASSAILQGNTVNYTCNKYVAGVLTPTTWNIQNLTGSSIPTSGYYTFAVTGVSSFSVKNLKMYSSGKVKIRCTDTQNTDVISNYIEINISLNGAW